jgi:REP element-mobilizing transposase RayT
MARPLRIEFPGALYHVISRGLEKRKIFDSTEDKEAFLKLLSKLHARYNFLIYAYCIMNNHYHLLVETLDGNLSQGIQNLNGPYAQMFNKKLPRSGPLFQGRYKAILVEKESYLLELSRYIVLNPVRANLVENPSDYTWSSYIDTIGLRDSQNFLATDFILSLFSRNVAIARREYRDFVYDGIGKIPPAAKGGIILGGEEFAVEIKELLKEKREIVEVPRRERFSDRPSLSEIFIDIISRPTRNRQIYLAFKEYGYSQKEIGSLLGLRSSTISDIIKNIELNAYHI